MFLKWLWKKRNQLLRYLGLVDPVHYINGADTLPPPLDKEQEQIVFRKLSENDPWAREQLIVHNFCLLYTSRCV